MNGFWITLIVIIGAAIACLLSVKAAKAVVARCRIVRGVSLDVFLKTLPRQCLSVIDIDQSLSEYSLALVTVTGCPGEATFRTDFVTRSKQRITKVWPVRAHQPGTDVMALFMLPIDTFEGKTELIATSTEAFMKSIEPPPPQ